MLYGCSWWRCRYIAIIHPLKPRMGAGLVLTVIAIIWVVSILIAFPTLLYAEIFAFKTHTVCYLNWLDRADFASVALYNLLYYYFSVNRIVVLGFKAYCKSVITFEVWKIIFLQITLTNPSQSARNLVHAYGGTVWLGTMWQNGGSVDSGGARVLFCPVYYTPLCQLSTSRFSPNLAMTCELMSPWNVSEDRTWVLICLPL